MPIEEGKNHEQIVEIDVYDTFALGEENKEKLEKMLYDLHDLTKLKFSELKKEENQVKFIKLYNALIQLISTKTDIADEALVAELTYYFSALQTYDTISQTPDAVASHELHELQAIAKRILSRFKLTRSEPEPKPKQNPIKKRRKTIRGRIFQQLSNLIVRPHDK